MTETYDEDIKRIKADVCLELNDLRIETNTDAEEFSVVGNGDFCGAKFGIADRYGSECEKLFVSVRCINEEVMKEVYLEEVVKNKDESISDDLLYMYGDFNTGGLIYLTIRENTYGYTVFNDDRFKMSCTLLFPKKYYDLIVDGIKNRNFDNVSFNVSFNDVITRRNIRRDGTPYKMMSKEEFDNFEYYVDSSSEYIQDEDYGKKTGVVKNISFSQSLNPQFLNKQKNILDKKIDKTDDIEVEELSFEEKLLINFSALLKGQVLIIIFLIIAIAILIFK